MEYILVPYSAELDAFGNMKESPQVTRGELLKMKKERINAYNITRRRRILTLPIFFIGAYANASKKMDKISYILIG